VTGLVTGSTEASAHCHVPPEFDPDGQRVLRAEVTRLIGAARWLATEIDEGRGCHAALLQASVLQADVDAISARLVDGHLKYCVTRAIGSGQTPDEVQGLLTPLQTLLFARR
jgi:DNA-binding FrmR family transcriptional regulator